MTGKSNSRVESGGLALQPGCVRFIRQPEILRRTGLSKITIYRMELEGRFPRRRKIGVHAVAWVEAEIDAWCAECAAGGPWEGGQ